MGADHVKLRLARADDLEAVCAIEAQSFTSPWHFDTFRSLLKRKQARVTVAHDPADGVLGYCVVWWVLDEGELANLAVREDRRGRGIGAALLDRAMEDLEDEGVRTVYLEVRASNRSAQRLYHRRGFVRVAIRPDYYRRPREDAWVLVRQLEQ